MPTISTEGDGHWFWDGYLDWSDYLKDHREKLPSDAPPGARDYVPVFLRLKPVHAERLNSARHVLHSLFGDDEEDTIVDTLAGLIDARIEPHELEALEAGLADDIAEFYVYVPRDSLMRARFRQRLLKVFDLLDVGATVTLTDTEPTPLDAGATVDAEAKLSLDKPVVAIIDDGIGFLNERFSTIDEASGHLKTRFAGLWVQAGEKADPSSASRILVGRELTSGDVDTLLSQGERLDEYAEYARLNRALLDAEAHRSTEFLFSHGTHVLDVAAGADPFFTASDEDIRVRNWPLLGVQLPPEAVEDTSGTRFETHVVMGVRWILARLDELYSNRPPVIINVSLGILAGPKNGTKFLEYQIARELARYPDAQVVYAFGNNYRSRQVAYFEAVGGTGAERDRQIAWMAPPDDFTASYLEIQLEGKDELPEEFMIGLTDPAGKSLPLAAVPSGGFVSLNNAAGQTYARVYHVPSRLLERRPGADLRTRAIYLLALAPTACRGHGDILAPSGEWTVSLRNDQVESENIILQIQRGDTAPGYEPLGRQSYFDGPNAYTFDPETQEYNGLGPGPITHQGTHSALTTVHPSVPADVAGRIHRAAGAIWRGDDEPRPADYSAQAAAWSDFPPTDCAISEDGYALEGVLASATTSSSIEALSGTSAAAPQVTRALAMTAEAELSPGSPGPAPLIPVLDPEAVKRLSSGVLARGGIRRRA